MVVLLKLVLLKRVLVLAVLALASGVSRRWAHGAGGWVTALPIIAGPIVLIMTLEHGAAFGAQASRHLARTGAIPPWSCGEQTRAGPSGRITPHWHPPTCVRAGMREGRPFGQEKVTVDAKFRRRLISAAAAALVGTAALAASSDPAYSTMSISSADGTSRAWISDNPIYGRAPQDLVGIEVVGSDGGSIGKIKAVVMGSDLQSAHAVIAMVESPGTGAREILVAFEELRLLADKVQVGLIDDAVVSRPGYQPKGYSALESSRPISEFAAFEPISQGVEPASDPASVGSATDGRRHSGGVEEASRGRPEDVSVGTQPENELDAAASVDAGHVESGRRPWATYW